MQLTNSATESRAGGTARESVIKRPWWTPAGIHLAIFIVIVILGVVVTRDYGESWDELQFFKYADHALEAYGSWLKTGAVPLTGNTYDNYGPAYVMIVTLAARLLGPVVPWLHSDLRHLVYFATYAVGTWAFYKLCGRWMSRNAAFGAALLFATQPLFWGHAFISPKDVPFLAFFVTSLWLGLRLVDANPTISLSELPHRKRQRLLAVTGAILLVCFAMVLLTPQIHIWIERLVSDAASGQINILGRLTSRIRPSNAPAHVQRYFVYFLWATAASLALGTVGLFLAWRKVPRALASLATTAFPAVALGLSTSIRVLGPLAGLFVAAYALRRYGRQALPLLATYLLMASVVTYTTWPYLWPDPLGHLVESVRVMAEYPWQGQVLFDGRMYSSTLLPATYLPVLLGIQLSEPVWPLFLIGLIIAARDMGRRRVGALGLLLLTGAWFAGPVIAFIVTRSPLYDNFRQVIFILPPVFMIAGVVFDRVKRLPLQIALIALVVMPGIVDGVHLHPYEYIYYNRFIGGVQGAFRKYELDYWGTSYREAAGYLNAVAPANANIWVEGPAHLIQVYARPDLKIFSTYEVERADHYDYVIALTRFDMDLKSFPAAPIVEAIQRDGALLAVIKKP